MVSKKIYQDVFSQIYENYGFGGTESRSGFGSTLSETKELREKIKALIQDKNIKSVIDIPCGDFNWMKEIVFSFESYIGGDIVENAVKTNNEKYSNSKIKFINFDLINDVIPTSDLLIVRDIIGHLPLHDGKKIIENILNSNCKYLLSTTWAKKTESGWSKCNPNDVSRENEGVEYGRFYPVNLMESPFNLPEPEIYLEEDVYVDNFENGNRKVLAFWDLSKIKNNEISDTILEKKLKNKNNTTLVTGLWDIGRGDLQEGWSRSFQHYLDKFQQLLQVDVNMIIFGDEELEKFVFNNRRTENTQFVRRELSWFKNNDFYGKIQNIRTNPDWYNQVGWLTDSTQAKLEMYNPLVMSKVYLLHDAKILDKFDSEYMFWIDAGLTNTIHPGYFTHDKVLDKLPQLVKNFHFVCFPYETNSEIHGFKYQELCELAGKPVNMVARAGFFGGKKDVISEINSIYYGLMNDTLSQGLMGTEESLFTIMTYKYPNLITYSEIDGNGLMGKFFEDLKDMTVEVKSEVSKDVVVNNLDTSKVGLYVITFNSPKQLEVLIQSMLDYDKDFIDKPRKFLLDNSTDLSTTPRYLELCEQYGFEHIKKDNIGIVGGRVFVAEHFDKTNLDFYYFFEDDMAFYPKKGEVCRNGFPRFVDNLYQKSLEIIQKENFDFLKLNFSEFFGDHSVQWSWYNVPQDFRQSHWPNNARLPVQGLDPNSPKTKFDEIHIHKGLPYITGESHLSNWPIVLTKDGNYKCYLETKWAHPFEQTLMSYAYQETVKGNIKPGLLLLTPTEHDRFDFYSAGLRKES
jgi:hypothetical protein